jgi:hypothetical protein
MGCVMGHLFQWIHSQGGMGGVGADVLHLPLFRFEEKCYVCIPVYSSDEYFGKCYNVLEVLSEK